MNEEVRIATIGGTFDTLHKGHKDYIQLAFKYADRVLIYVTSDEFVIGKKSYFDVKPYKIRQKHLQDFVEQIGYKNRYEIRCLRKLQQLESELLKEKIFMSIITPEYYDFFLKINNTRQELGRNAFLILIKLRTRDAKNGDISSREIRYLHPKLRDSYTQ